MNHQKRGLAIIFNHEFFNINHLKPRSGTNVDCNNLIETLKDLDFEVTDFHNATHRDIVKNLEQSTYISLTFLFYSKPIDDLNTLLYFNNFHNTYF